MSRDAADSIAWASSQETKINTMSKQCKEKEGDTFKEGEEYKSQSETPISSPSPGVMEITSDASPSGDDRRGLDHRSRTAQEGLRPQRIRAPVRFALPSTSPSYPRGFPRPTSPGTTYSTPYPSMSSLDFTTPFHSPFSPISPNRVGDIHGGSVKSAGSYKPRPEMRLMFVNYNALSPSRIRLRCGVYVEQFLLQLTFPLTLPFVLWRYGIQGCVTMRYCCAKQFKRHDVWAWVLQWIPSSLFLLTLALFIAQPKDDSNISYTSIGMMIVSFILHRSVIAMKYAFMSRRRYSAALKSVRGLEINRQEELLNSWISPSRDLIKAEIKNIGRQLGIPLQEAEFHVTREAATAHSSIFKFNSVKTLVGEGREAEVYRLNVAHVLTETMDRYCKSLRTFLKPLAPCIALVQSLLPFLVSYFESGVAFGTNGQAIFINIGSAFCSFVYWALVLSFLSVGVLDFKRRHYMQRALTEMIMRSTTISTNTSSIRLPPQSTRSQAATVRSSVTARKVFSFESSATAAASDDFLLRSGPLHLITEDAEGFTPDEAKSKVFLKHSAPWSSFYRSSSMSVRAREKQPSSFPPLIELDTTHNVATWLLMRRVANYLGARYWKRVQLVLAQLFLVTAAVLICVAVALLYPDVLLISLTAQATVGFVCLILLVMTLHTIRWGALTNSQVDWQVAVLNDEQTKIRQLTGIEWLGRRHKRAVQLEYTVWMISSVKKSLKLDVSLNPVQVLGMAASTTMVRTLMATFFPVVMFFVRFALHASSIVF